MVTDTKRTVGDASTNRDHLDIRAMVADVVTDLLQATKGRKIGDRVCKHDLATQRHPGRDADHVLLCHAHVDKLIRVGLSKLLDHRVTEISHDQANARIFAGKIEEAPHESRSHGYVSSSRRAAPSSPSVGGR